MQGFPYDPKSKKPAITRWHLVNDNLITDDCTLKIYAEQQQAVGLLLKECLVVDVDTHKNGLDALAKLSKTISYDIAKKCRTCVRSGYNGFHYYFSLPALPPGKKVRIGLPNYKGIDFKTDQIIAPYSKIDRAWYVKKYGKNQLPPKVGEYWYIRGDVFNRSMVPDKLLELLIYDPQTLLKKIDIEEPLKKLSFLDPIEFRDYDRWISLLFAAKEAGISLTDFTAWCVKDSEYATPYHRDSIRTQWDGAKGEGITPLTLDYFFRESGHSVTDIIDITEALEEVEEKCRKPLVDRSTFKDWIFVESQEKFYNMRGNYYNTITNIQKTLSYCLGDQKIFDLVNTGMIARCIGFIFQPHAAVFLEKDGYKYYNLWRKPTLESKENCCQPFLNFMKHYWPSDYHYAIEWMAAIAQKRRPRYMLLIHSAENQIGKSTIIGSLMRKICGELNTFSLKEKHIRSEYNGYLARAHLVMIEEMHAGASKLQFYNTVKEMITENKIMLDEKYEKSYMIDNHAVFLAFTNYFDAMMAKENDPRVLFLSTFKPPLPIERYEALHQWLDNGGYEAVYSYLKHYKLEQKPFSHAPNTKAKAQLADAVKCDSEIFLEENVFNDPTNFSDEFICFSLLKDSITTKNIPYKRLRMVLLQKGYQKIEVSIENKKERVYVSALGWSRAEASNVTINQYVRLKWPEMMKKFDIFG